MSSVAQVGVEFTGNPSGAIAAAKQTTAAVEQVTQAAKQSSPGLRGMEHDLGRVERGALSGSGALRGLGRSVAFASTSFLGAYGLAAAVRGAADELVNQIKINAQVAQVLRNTGGVAGVTAAHIKALADEELRKTGIDDDLIKKSELILLTFDKVRDVAGKQNDVFSRATRLSADLGTQMGDTSQAATLLGKALQDPVASFGQLRRAGIILDDDTKKQIKTLVEHGNVLAAQKIILDQVQGSVGGLAKRVGDAAPWMRLRETLKNLSAEAIKPLIPEMDGVTGRVQKWADELANNSEKQQKLKDDVKEGIGVVKDFAGGAEKVVGVLGGWKNAAELVIGLKVASWAGETLVGVNKLIGSVGQSTGLKGADGAAKGLLGRLKTLTSKPWIIAAALSFVPPSSKGQQALDKAGIGFLGHLPFVGGAEQQIGRGAAYVFGGNLVTPKQQPVQVGSDASATGASVSAFARKYGVGSGITYHWGGVSPITGFDCSGYVWAAYKAAGVDIPRDTRGQWNDPNAIKVQPGDERPGDAVYFHGDLTGKNAGPPPGHVGIYMGGGIYIQYFSEGKPAATSNLSLAADYMGARRWAKVGSSTAGADPPKSGKTGSSTASTNPLPSGIRQAIAAADIGAARAALTPGKADDKAAAVQQRRAIEDEIAWLDAKLKTKLGAEKRITYEDLLTGALGDLQGLAPGKKTGGTGIATIIGLRNTVTNDLKDLPASLDDIERNAVSHLEKLRASLKAGMSSKDLATTRVGIQNWGKVLKDEISKQTKAAQVAAAAAASEASRQWDRSWQNDVNNVLRNFNENVAQPQIDAFDRTTAAGLKKMQDDLGAQLDAFDKETSDRLAAIKAKYDAQTPEEKALADFEAQRTSDQRAKQRADLQSQIKDTQDQLGQLGVGSSGGGGVLIDIATGTRTALQQTSSDIVSQQKTLTQQLLDLQDQWHQMDLDDQDAALKALADASRVAADKQAEIDQQTYQADRDAARKVLTDKESDAEDSYTRLRNGQRQALQDRLDDQATALSQDLDDWGIWIGKKQKSYQDFLNWLAGQGVPAAGVTDPNLAVSLHDPAGAVSPGGDPRGSTRLGGLIGFAAGGKVPGRYVGRQDTIMARLTPGEHVASRKLTAAMEDFFLGGGGGFTVVAGDVYLDGQKVGQHVARGVTDAQARQGGYTIQRG